ncbi:MAG: hypothetical protein ACEQR5_01635 [Moraxellaceae bacterium]|jgi:hypothetical protein
MKNSLILVIACSLFLAACGNDEVENTVSETTTPPNELNLDFDQRARREVEAKLQIPVTEKYAFKVYKEFINADTIQDAIITVNRMEYAISDAIKKNKQAKMAEIGFMGNYNFFFYYDGATDQFSVPLPVPSSPGRPLEVSFKNMVSDLTKDVIIDYRIRNSGWRSYFSVFNETDLTLVFQWKLFDYAGEEKPEALLHVLEASREHSGKDILIYNSEIDHYSQNIGDMYQYVPSISKPNKLAYRFYFEPKFGKYTLYKTGPGSERAQEFINKSRR